MSLRPTLSWLCLIILYFLGTLPVAGTQALAAVSGQEAFYLAVKEFEALSRERQRGMRRDSWETLEKRFADIQAHYPGLAPEALFYRGRTLEELGDRSKKKDDYQAAHDRYADLTRLYSTHPLADNACFNQAVLLAVSLRDELAAITRLNVLMERYPESDLFPEAMELRERLRDKKPSPSPSPPPVETKPQSKELRSVPLGNDAAQGPPSPLPSPENAPHPKAEERHRDADDRATAHQASLYAEAAARWRELLADKDKAGIRENWLKLEKDFLAAQATAPWGDMAAKAAYQAARCRYELAVRSGSKGDWLRAKDLFEDTAKTYPEHALADDSLYFLAEIRMSRLKQMEEGRRTALELIRLYPSGDMRLKTETLLQRHAPRAERVVPPRAASGATTGAAGTALLEQLGLTMKTIMVDAGHGGHDPGAVGNGLRESGITLDLAKK
ncbi:MAG: tetratricopeptide repeat protein, partial [Deltaproteobacteria bacterium]|nr:tetratricopeptide repeat protein [Deltaproteobacteria bacterium]